MDNKRQTIQCSIVLDTVKSTHGHSTADEIYRLVKENYPSISRATVYRNLNKLSDDGLVRKISIPGSADRFEKMSPPHYHIKCLSCGTICDVEMEYIADIENSIPDRHGFEIISHDIIFSGICPRCRERSSNSSLPSMTEKEKK